ncbi:MAG: hypothetical protein HY655_05115 [Acidobacteria bacterium]|nr:hypothetical protein [Acidobacteriota bacterium]
MTIGKWIAGVALIAALVIPAAAWAHEGHSEKVMGTVASIQDNHVMVKTTAGKTVMVMLDAKTKITRGKTTLKAADVKVGDRVVAEGPLEKEMLMATSVQLGAAPAASVKSATEPAHSH